MNHFLLNTPFWLVDSCFLTVYSHHREDELALLPLHMRAQTPWQGPTHMLSYNLIAFSNHYFQVLSHGRLECLCMQFRWICIQCLTDVYVTLLTHSLGCGMSLGCIKMFLDILYLLLPQKTQPGHITLAHGIGTHFTMLTPKDRNTYTQAYVHIHICEHMHIYHTIYIRMYICGAWDQKPGLHAC